MFDCHAIQRLINSRGWGLVNYVALTIKIGLRSCTRHNICIQSKFNDDNLFGSYDIEYCHLVTSRYH